MRNVTASVHNAVREGKLSFKVPTQAYLDRIEALGKPTGLNSIVIVNVSIGVIVNVSIGIEMGNVQLQNKTKECLIL